MDSRTLSRSTTTNSLPANKFFSQTFFHASDAGILTFPYRKSSNLLVLSLKYEPKLDHWDQMELRFGKMIVEDPKVTVGKIIGRKSKPNLSLEIEKLLDKNKGRALDKKIEDRPFDVSHEKKSTKSIQGLNFVRPFPKKGTKYEATNKAVEASGKKSSGPVKKCKEETKSSIPKVILRKPSLFDEDGDSANWKSSKFGMKPNLSLKMGKEQKDRFSDITLLKKPEPVSIRNEENAPSDFSNGKHGVMDENGDKGLKHTLPQKSGMMKVTFVNEGEQESSNEMDESNFNNVVPEGNFGISQTDSGLDEGSKEDLLAETSSGEEINVSSDGSSRSIHTMSMGSVLKGKPERLDRTSNTPHQKIKEEMVSKNRESFGSPSDLENFFTTSPIKESEDVDWEKAQNLVKTGEREEVELISSSNRGFVVSFGSMIGFLPYHSLAGRWKFLGFESWLGRKGLDPSNYMQNLPIIGRYESNSIASTSKSILDPDIVGNTVGEITSDMKLEDLLMIYDRDKLKFLSSFVGQKIKVGVVLADRNSRRLILSIKPKENEELVEKKRSLMARLSVGDVVKCSIKTFTYFGVFVEVEGVPALIHQTEVSWEATSDPASLFKVGQIVDAKVHRLDFLLERIFLSFKKITPDPLMEALETVVGDLDALDGRHKVAQADTEWADAESLIKELEQFDGIQSVSRGRYFVSPGLAPTFQVYMASIFENQYKLLARAGNRVQEVIVQTCLSKDEMKSAIMTCTMKV